jgi:hypothetical protein
MARQWLAVLWELSCLEAEGERKYLQRKKQKRTGVQDHEWQEGGIHGRGWLTVWTIVKRSERMEAKKWSWDLQII